MPTKNKNVKALMKINMLQNSMTEASTCNCRIISKSLEINKN